MEPKEQIQIKNMTDIWIHNDTQGVYLGIDQGGFLFSNTPDTSDNQKLSNKSIVTDIENF